MCGISGIVQKEGDPVSPELLEKMSAGLLSRGPDAHGFFIHENIGMSQRRLKILDLSDEANQPFFSPDRKLCMVYNGEIYNFKELREELKKKGHSFKTNSDTEVVIHSFEEWGIEAFTRWNGIFALAVLDLREKDPTLYLIRDRFGVKPLFYSESAGAIAFSSVLQPFFQISWVSRRIHQQALFQFLQLSHIHCPDSILSGVKQLPPGHFLVFKGGESSLKEYWSPNLLNARKTPRRSDSSWLEEFEELFKKVVTRQIISDVPLGCFLSGGIDSSLIAATYGEICSEKLKTYCVGYQEKEFDESPYSQKVSELLHTEHRLFRIKESDCLELIDQIPTFFDQPMADPTLLSSLLLSRLARQDVTVALSGDGADELFFGYPYEMWIRFLMRRKWVPPSFRKGFFRAAEGLVGKGSRSLMFHRARKLAQILQYKGEAELFQYFVGMIGPLRIPQVAELLVEPPEYQVPIFQSLLEDVSSSQTEDRITQVFVRTFLVDTVLAKADRAGMAYGLEVRVPFLDNEMAEFSSRVPFHLKYHKGVNKVLLRRSLEKKMPKMITARKKQGFSIPLREWLRGGMKPLLDLYLNESRLKREGVFAPARIKELVNEHMEERANHSHLLWALLCFQLWKEKYRL